MTVKVETAVSSLEVPCDILTGFLGSGKTTILRHVLDQGLDGRRVAILMNEIGDVGIDGPVISELDGIEAMVELNSGCVCCSIDEFSFATAFRQIVDEIRPDLVVIETTGLADPGPVLARLEGVGAAHDAIITVVDAVNFHSTETTHPVLRQQVAAADFLVVNKTDLVTRSQITVLERALDSINPHARRILAHHGRVPMELIFATGAGRARATAAATSTSTPEHHHDRNSNSSHGIDSFSFKGAQGLDVELFRAFIDDLPPEIFRAKGLLDPGNGQPPMMFNYVCGRLNFEPLPTLCGRELGTQAVFIGEKINHLRSATIEALQHCIPVFS